jgi:hypothetical protein
MPLTDRSKVPTVSLPLVSANKELSRRLRNVAPRTGTQSVVMTSAVLRLVFVGRLSLIASLRIAYLDSDAAMPASFPMVPIPGLSTES